MEEQRRQKDAIHTAGQGIKWYVASSIAILETPVGTLIEWGFTLNPYDQCVMNNIINGKQFTVVWHVDDLKISHM